jgi:butyrate kinase
MAMINNRILVINPGSTSTKIAVYQNYTPLFLKSINHPIEELRKFKKIADQYEFRKKIVLNELKHAEIELESISIIIGRGGLIKPIESGIYEVNEAMLKDLKEGYLGEHASNLGGLISYDLAKSLPNAKALIADPVVVDELQDVARIAGHPKFKRYSIFHALNQKAIARSYAYSHDKKYEELNLIVAHLGGGISVGAHCKGKVIDVNNALDGEGPFSPERSGTIPAGQLVTLCYSNEYQCEDVKKMIIGEGGLIAYLGTNDAYKVELQARAGDQQSIQIQEAMSYQVGKAIGEMAVVLKGDVDAILLTGGIANNSMVTDYVKSMVKFIAQVIVYPGDDEMKALAQNALRVIKGEVQYKIYK